MRPVSVVTGAGRGIGAATALRLANAGHDLAISYLRDDQSAHDVAERVRHAGRQ